MCTSYRSPKTEIKKSPIEGYGLFATQPIKKSDVVAIKGGHVLDEKALQGADVTSEVSYLQIEENFYIGASSKTEVEKNKLYINHSCEPNVGIRGQITFVAKRDIEPGKELTYDWAMEEAKSDRMECKCGTKSCRKILTGEDWKNPELQRRYEGYFSAYLQEKIQRLRS